MEINREGFKGFFVRYLWSKADGCPNFAMRLMEFEPQGQTSFHSHLEEHEIFILQGEPVYVDAQGKEIPLEVGETIYVAPEEPHQIKNKGGTVATMLCMIPILPEGNGKSTTPGGQR